jgi:hypothetical protein
MLIVDAKKINRVLRSTRTMQIFMAMYPLEAVPR